MHASHAKHVLGAMSCGFAAFETWTLAPGVVEGCSPGVCDYAGASLLLGLLPPALGSFEIKPSTVSRSPGGA